MTKDEIIEMADKADEEADNVLNMKGEYHPNWHQVRDEAFAKLVAEKERAACWDIIFDYAGRDDITPKDESLLKHLADLIKARGQA